MKYALVLILLAVITCCAMFTGNLDIARIAGGAFMVWIAMGCVGGEFA